MMLALVMVPLSGCVEAEEFFAEMEDEYESWNEHEEEHHDEWEEEVDDEGEDAHHTPHRHHHEHDHDEYDDAFSDADVRYDNHVDGDEDSTRSINIGWRDDDLRVALKYELDGEVEIQLRNPLGFLVAEEEFDGEKEMDEEDWYTVSDPMSGEWSLSIEIDGEGAYAFGAYIDE